MENKMENKMENTTEPSIIELKAHLFDLDNALRENRIQAREVLEILKKKIVENKE